MALPRLSTLFLLALAVTGAADGAPTGSNRLPLAYTSERAPLLSTRALGALVATNISTPGNPAVEAACGGMLPRTRHTIHCLGGYPVGGVVLEPPNRPTRSVLWLHGITNIPTSYLTALSVILADAPADPWATTRILMPLAPVYGRLRFPAPTTEASPMVDSYAWFDPSPLFTVLPLEVIIRSTAEEIVILLAASTVGEDRLGLTLSTTRLVDLVGRQAHGRLGRRLPPVPRTKTAIVGHSLGAYMAWHMAVRSGVPFAGVVACSGGLPLVPYYTLYPALGSSRRPRPPVASIAADGDELVLPQLTEAAVLAGRLLLGGKDVVRHTNLRGSDHSSYLFGDPNTRKVRRVVEGALRGVLVDGNT